VTLTELADRDTLAVLGRAPTPAEAAKLTPGQVRTALRAGGRVRNIDARAQVIVDGLRTEALTAPDDVVAAFAATTRAQVAIIDALNTQIAALDTELANHFEQHPEADIYLSLPGIGVILGARVLAEFGDDPNRYDNAKSRKNYAGTSPITRASGNRSVALARFVRPRRLADAIDQWAFCSLSNSPGARAHYDHRRAQGDSHHKALPRSREPPRRHPPRLPPPPQHLRRDHRLGPPQRPAHPTRLLTPTSPGVSDSVETVGAALLAAAGGLGHRRVAERVGLPATTVRGWLRRARANSDAVRCATTVTVHHLDLLAHPLAPTGGALGDMLPRSAERSRPGCNRFGPVPAPWQLAVALTGAAILAPPPHGHVEGSTHTAPAVTPGCTSAGPPWGQD
jgi:hypothetical protein